MVHEIGDMLAKEGKPLKAATIRRVLSKDLLGQVDTDGSAGVQGRWWRLR